MTLSPYIGNTVTANSVCGACTTADKRLLSWGMMDEVYDNPEDWGAGRGVFSHGPTPRSVALGVFSHSVSMVAQETTIMRSVDSIIDDYVQVACDYIRRGVDDMMVPEGAVELFNAWDADDRAMCLEFIRAMCDTVDDFLPMDRVSVVSTRGSVTIPLYHGDLSVPLCFTMSTKKRGLQGVVPFFYTGESSIIPSLFTRSFTPPGEAPIEGVVLWDTVQGKLKSPEGDIPDMFQ